jgi:hypothetical protein
VEPGKRKDLRMEFRKEKFKKEGFKTGMDLFDEVNILTRTSAACIATCPFCAAHSKSMY